MKKLILALPVLLLAGFSAFAQQGQKPLAADSKIPPEAAKQANPVKPTLASIAQGKKLYGFDCEMCHGKDGDGKGDLAVDMKLTLLDYRDPASLKDRTDGELFYIIKNGKGDMPAEGDRSKADAVWDLVNYIRSMAKKDSAPKPKPTP